MKFTLCLLISLVGAVPSFAQKSLGLTTIEVPGESRNRPLTLSLWYPGTGGLQQTVTGNAVFSGVLASRNASVDQADLPVILVSHGGLRSTADSGAWISAALASAGYLVIEVNTPRPTSAAEAVNEIWLRPEDISYALDAVLQFPEWADAVDTEQISVLGFALGGTAALALAGGQLDLTNFVQACDRTLGGPDCAWFQAEDVNLDTVNEFGLAQKHRDPRIGSVVVINPEHLNAFLDGLSSVAVRTLLISLGSEITDQPALETSLAIEVEMPGANVFDAFQICKEAGSEILREDDGDPAMCGTSEEERMRVHSNIISEVLTFLAQTSDN